MTNEATIQEIFQDQAFVKKLFELETPEEVVTALRQKNLVLSVAEIVNIRELLLKRLEAGAELSDEELANVTGGSVTAVCIATIVFAAIGGMALFSTVAALCTDTLTRGRW